MPCMCVCVCVRGEEERSSILLPLSFILHCCFFLLKFFFLEWSSLGVSACRVVVADGVESRQEKSASLHLCLGVAVIVHKLDWRETGLLTYVFVCGGCKEVNLANGVEVRGGGGWRWGGRYYHAHTHTHTHKRAQSCEIAWWTLIEVDERIKGRFFSLFFLPSPFSSGSTFGTTRVKNRKFFTAREREETPTTFPGPGPGMPCRFGLSKARLNFSKLLAKIFGHEI